MRIIYVDYFGPESSNSYWLTEFQKRGVVVTYDILQIKDDLKEFKEAVLKFKPTHIHFGGSVKSAGYMPPILIREIREACSNTRITFFYGDAYNEEKYYHDLAPYASEIFMSNASFNYTYMPCPAPKENTRQWQDDKKYDIVFIGNNYNQERLNLIKQLSKFKIVIFGNKWPDEVDCRGIVSLADYPNVCAQAWIVFGDPAGPVCERSGRDECTVGNPDSLYDSPLCRSRSCSEYEDLNAYLSNRLMNTLISGSVHLAPYVKGMEQYWIDRQDLVWYKTEQERDKAIEELLNSPELCKEIASSAQSKVLKKYTFEKCARRILNG